MRLCAYISAVLGLMVVCLSASQAVGAPAPPGSFTTRVVSSTDQLAELTRTDKVTAGRYARHFGMQPAELVEYFRGNLRLTTLGRSGNYTIYYTTKNGRIVARKAKLSASERVFAGHDGTPLILLKCGNPLVKRLPTVEVKAVLPPATPTAPETVEFPKPESVLPTMEPITLAQLITPEDPPIIPEPEPVTAVLPEVLAFREVATYVLPALIGAVAVRTSSTPETPVPEPASLLVVGLGVSSVFLHGLKRYRVRR